MIKNFCLAFLFLGTALFAQDAPDWILYGGKIFTSAPNQPWVEAIAVQGDRIVAAGANASVLATLGPQTRRTDLRGRTMIPGINDAHIHVWLTHVFPLAAGTWAGTEGMREPTLDAVLAAIRNRLTTAAEGTWITAEVGEKVLSNPAANRFTLDEIAPKHRVLLIGWTGHGAVLNTAGLRALGIAEEEPDPVGGWYERVSGTRLLNGVLHGAANFSARACLLATVPDSVVTDRLQEFFQEALRFGITSIQDMSVLSPARIVRLLEQAKPPIRWREIRSADMAQRCAGSGDERNVGGNPLPLVTVSGVKYQLDGTPVERLAWMRDAYADREGFFGMPYFGPNEIASRIAAAQATGEQPLFHVVGDRTAETVLTELSRAPDPTLIDRLRPRIEHGDWVTSEFFSLARVLGATVVQNPSHFTLSELMVSRFGANRTTRVFPLKSLLNGRIPLALGSDGLLHPFLNILFATIHPANPPEALTRQEAVIAYTRGSAYAEFAERDKGTLEPGMLADFAVLSQDVFTVPPDALPATQSVLTVVGGRVAFDGGVLQRE